MSSRVRWIVLGVVALVVIGVVALYVFNTDLTMSTNLQNDEILPSEAPAPKTWKVQPGETLNLTDDETGPDDVYRCPGKGGVVGTPDRGHGVGGSGGFSVETALDGTVTAYCEPGPPGNV
jgi:hypothetical protein